jgi:hypothetical protein
MRLYSRTGAATVHNEDHGKFDVDPDTGAVDLPDELGTYLHGQHIDGQPAWEDDAERHARLETEDRARRSDPASLYDLLDNRLGRIEARLGQLEANGDGEDKPATPKRSHTRKAAE